ncbi:hypothetical protein ACXR2T_03980 [Leucobacter sp. HY1910]
MNEAMMLRLLSEPRFNRYLESCEGNFENAVSLYVANIRLSGAAIEAINIVEVVLRNSVDVQLRRWNMQQGGAEQWTKHPEGELAFLLRQGNDVLVQAARRAQVIVTKICANA